MILKKSPDKHICTIIREVEDITKLVELQDQLEEKVEQLNVVSFKSSHLLRNPVANIISLVDMIEEQGISGKQADIAFSERSHH